MTAANLFRALHTAGASYRVIGESVRFAKGTVPPELVAEIHRHKPALLSGACSLCGAELATHGDRCAWCDAVRGREVDYVPGSNTERMFLAALNNEATDVT